MSRNSSRNNPSNRATRPTTNPPSDEPTDDESTGATFDETVTAFIDKAATIMDSPPSLAERKKMMLTIINTLQCTNLRRLKMVQLEDLTAISEKDGCETLGTTIIAKEIFLIFFYAQKKDFSTATSLSDCIDFQENFHSGEDEDKIEEIFTPRSRRNSPNPPHAARTTLTSEKSVSASRIKIDKLKRIEFSGEFKDWIE
jgi:hypothetical protein